jgi:hypothetical protein
MSTYSDLLKSPKWQKKRLEIMQRDKFACKKCGDSDTQLQVHHLKYENNKDPWEYSNKDLLTLCSDCHYEIEQLKKSDYKLDFTKIKIYKLKNEKSKYSRIMFLSDRKYFFISCYNEDNLLQIAFELGKISVSNIKRIISYYNGI